jgi:hypothetical protein
MNMPLNIKVGTYADFLHMYASGFSGLSWNLWYADMTGASGPFYLYAIATTGAAVFRVKLDVKPSTLTADFGSGPLASAVLNAPLEF